MNIWIVLGFSPKSETCSRAPKTQVTEANRPTTLLNNFIFALKAYIHG
jgi:hypothetical protein